MAFGKEQEHLGNVPAFGGNFVQRAKTQARRPPRTGGGKFYWKDTYKAPEHQPDVIRLIPGQYTVPISHDGENIVQEEMTYVPFKEHHNGQRGAICAAGALWGSKLKAQPCPSCVIFWEDVNERKAKKARGDNTKGPKRMSCRDQFAFNVWDYGLYFQIPDTDRNGQIRMSQQTNQPYTSWVKGNPNDPTFAGKPFKHGHLLAWPMGGTYKDTLIEWAKRIGQSCKGCGSMATVHTVMKVCGNTQCGQFIYDPNNCTLSNEQREQIDFYPYTCPHCKQSAYVGEVIECSNCQAPERATLFDVDLQVQRLGTKGQQTFLQIFTHSEPRPIQVADPEILKTIQPLDLLKKFSPTSPEAQAKLFNIQGAAAPQAGQPPIVGMGTPGTPPMQQAAPQQPVVQPPVVPGMQPPMTAPQAPMQYDPQPQATAQGMPPQPSPQTQLQLPMESTLPAAPMPPSAPMPPVAPQPPMAPTTQPQQGAVAQAQQAATQMPAVPYQVPQIPGSGTQQ